MTEEKVQNLKHGLYKIYWNSGGTSLASVGSLSDGSRWFAATNWQSKTGFGIIASGKSWRSVKKMELIID